MKRWLGFLAVGLVLLLAAVYDYQSHKNQALNEGFESTRDASRRAIEDVDRTLSQLTELSELVARMDRDSLRSGEALSRLRVIMDKEPQLNQLGYALNPQVMPGQRLSGPYCWRNNGKVECARLESRPGYDYTHEREDTAWYHRAKRDGDGWSEPYFDVHTRANLAEHTRRLQWEDAPDGFAGVVYANYSLETLTDLVKNLDLGRGGYAFIIAPQGRLISYPNRADLAEKRKLQELADAQHSEQLREIGRWVDEPQERPLIRDMKDPMTGRRAWFYCDELARSGWRMCTVTLVRSAIHNQKALALKRLNILFAATLLLLVGLAMLLKVGLHKPRTLWTWSLAGVGLLCGDVGYVWHLARTGHLHETWAPAVISSAEVNGVARTNQERLAKLHYRSDLITVPTGIQIQQITTADKQMQLSGIVWQRYLPQDSGDPTPGTAGNVVTAVATPAAQDEKDALPPWVGVTFPAATEVEMQEVFRQEVAGKQVIGWRFQFMLPEQFDGTDFPIDQDRITLELAPRSFSEPVLLVPDLAAYDNIVTSAHPGVSATLELPGWRIDESSFSYTEQHPNTDFGLGQAGVARSIDSLRFNITVRRVFLNPFISHVLPVIILLFLMFAVLLLGSRNSELAERFGFNASTSIGAYGTFFFIAVLQHVSLRQSLAAAQLVYFEWFYILIYVLLLLLSLNALLFASDSQVRFVHHQDNLWPKLLYWPLTAVSMLAITLVWFS